MSPCRSFLRNPPLFPIWVLAAFSTLSLLIAPAALAQLDRGSIAGTAVRAADGSPIAEGRVYFFDAEGRPQDSARVVDGRFASELLYPGTYFALMENTAEEVGQLFGGGAHCFNDSNPFNGQLCDPLDGAPIVAAAGRETAIAFALIDGGSISGNVFDPAGQLAEGPDVEVLTADGRMVWRWHFLSYTPYRAAPLPPGSYLVRAWARDLARQVYRDYVCIVTCTLELGGEPVTLALGEDRDRVDLHLHRYGSLAGRVEDRTSGQSLANIDVRLYEAATGLRYGSLRTLADGSFVVPRLPPGRYLAAAGAPDREWRATGDVPFLERDEAAALLLATAFTVPEGGRLELPPLRLRQLGRIRGRILDGVTGEPIPGAQALALTRDGEPSVGRGTSDDNGDFEIAGLDPGTYYLLIDGPEGRDLLVGGNEVCVALPGSIHPSYAQCDPTRGRPFTLTFEQVSDAGQVELPAAARLRGTVRLAPGRVGRPSVQVFTAARRQVANFRAGAGGDHADFDVSVPGGGSYFLLALGAAEHLAQLYDHVDCLAPGQCVDFIGGTPVAVSPGQVREGLDFDLRLDQRACVPSATRLCLGGGRFTVTSLHAENGSGVFSEAARITDEAGYFTFFDPANVEVVVKVLDACRDYDAIWVFAAGLTDVSNNLTLRDNWAAITRSYSSAGPYQPLVDTTGFATCDAEPLLSPGATAVSEIAPGIGTGNAAEPAASAPAPAQPASLPAPGLAPNGCGSDPATSLCLGGRFRVEVEWETALGEEGAGRPVALTADTGFFYFFSPGNIEVVVKVLDACRTDLGNRYWVFAAGLTDVAVTLKVTDTATGAEKIYLKPLGGLFPPILDLDAFATCG